MTVFIDPETREKVCEVSQYTENFKTKVCRDRNGKDLVNSKGQPLIPIKKDIDWSDFDIAYSTFNSLRPEQKRDLLKKRADDHFKKKGQEQKKHMEETAIKQMKEKFSK